MPSTQQIDHLHQECYFLLFAWRDSSLFGPSPTHLYLGCTPHPYTGILKGPRLACSGLFVAQDTGAQRVQGTWSNDPDPMHPDWAPQEVSQLPPNKPEAPAVLGALPGVNRAEDSGKMATCWWNPANYS